jgi:hypothetical protein
MSFTDQDQNYQLSLCGWQTEVLLFSLEKSEADRNRRGHTTQRTPYVEANSGQKLYGGNCF